MTQARVDALEDMTPDEVRKMVYLGGQGLRVQMNTGPNTWGQVVKTSPDHRHTTMGLGRTKRISFAHAKMLGETLKDWATGHTMQECGEAAARFRALAETDVVGRHVSWRALADAWQEAMYDSSDHDRQLLDRLRDAVGSGGGGGEGEEHEELKKLVRSTPSLVDLPPQAVAMLEYKLASHDLVYVIFCWQGKMIAVEVKSIISNADDIRRGLFQCIKYKAVTEAMLQAIGEEPDVRSILVLGGRLPTCLGTIKERLGVEVKENVGP